MTRCTVKGCSNRSSHKNSKQEELEKTMKITFHSFPKCPIRHQLWLNSLGLQNSDVPKYAAVCSDHFRYEHFDRTSLVCTRLRENAVPYVKLSECKVEEKFNPCEEISTEEPSTSTSSAVMEEETGDSVGFTGPTIVTGEKRRHVGNTASHEVCEKILKIETEYKNEQMQETQVSLVDKCTSISPKRLFHSPKKQILREQISKLKRTYQLALNALKEKNRRKNRRIVNLETILRALRKKNLLEEEQAQSLSGMSGFNNELFERVTRKNSDRPVVRTYSPELRLFSLTLNYYSPRAYCYVPDKFNLCLPHPKTLFKWYRSVNGEPGFNDEAIRYVKAYSDSLEERLFVTLIIDEVAIRQHIEFDGQKFIGLVDVGSAFACDEKAIAKEALVFLLVGLNKAWKIPVGYFLIDKLNSEQKANLINHCLRSLHDTGVKVVCLTCDGMSSNIGISSILGCNFSNVSSLKTSFSHPVTRAPVYFILDTSHMVKLIRNTLGDLKCILNPNKERIEWKYIEKLHELQEREGLHLANKLRKQHVEYSNKKMKVKYATQVLSSSVSKALCMCRCDLRLEEFKNSQPTEEFLQEVNDLFDIFNSRNLRQKYFKEPLNPDNYNSVLNKLEHCEYYIRNLMLVNEQKIVLSQRKTGFLGFLICIQTLKELYKDIGANRQVAYIPFYQCSQDHLEIFFSCVRSLGGSNNNPTARQFKTAFRKLLIHNEIKSSGSGNCLPLYNIPILHYCGQSSVEIINNSTSHLAVNINADENSKRVFDKYEEELQILEFHSYTLEACENSSRYSEFVDRVVVYIAGWITKKLSSILKCPVCVACLSSDNESNTIYKLIRLQSRGGLALPIFGFNNNL